MKIINDYMNLYSPYRGLLLFHGLGSGKTCSSISIAEGFKHAKKVVVMTPASLQMNYRSELKKCGDALYKYNQFWEFVPIENDVELQMYSSALSIPRRLIKKLKLKRVNGIMLGWTDTPNEDVVQKQQGSPDDWLSIGEEDSPFGRLLKPYDVAKLTCFLLSSDSGVMTGSLIDQAQRIIGTLSMPDNISGKDV